MGRKILSYATHQDFMYNTKIKQKAREGAGTQRKQPKEAREFRGGELLINAECGAGITMGFTRRKTAYSG